VNINSFLTQVEHLWVDSFCGLPRPRTVVGAPSFFHLHIQYRLLAEVPSPHDPKQQRNLIYIITHALFPR
jgi:hypothetical protein